MSDNFTTADAKQVRELVSRLCDGGIEPDEFADLEQLLSAHDEARRLYYDLLVLHGELGWLNGAAQLTAAQLTAAGPLGLETSKLAAPEPATSEPAHTERIDSEPDEKPMPATLALRAWRVMNQPAVFSCFSAMLLLVGVLLLLELIQVSPWRHIAPAPPAQPPVVVARISAAHQAVWISEAEKPRVGYEVLSGEVLRLESGLAQIIFESGAVVQLEGPAELELQTARRGRLATGQLVAEVPRAAIGFTVDLPYARVVDLGTEFGVSADGGFSGVHVFRGSVQVEPMGGGDPLRLYAGEAVQVMRPEDGEQPQIVRIEAAPEGFARLDTPPQGSDQYAQAVLASRPVAYWRFNEAAGTRTAADHSGNGYEQSLGGGGLLTRGDSDRAVGPRPGDTVAGSPLVGFENDNQSPYIDGGSATSDPRFGVDGSRNNAILRVGYGSDTAIADDVVPSNNYTVELWLRATQSPEQVAYLVQRLGVGAGDNADPAGGDMLSLSPTRQLTFYAGTGRRDELQPPLALGRWHHLVLVRDGATVSIYHNGRLHSRFEGIDLPDEADHFGDGNWVFGARRDRDNLKLTGNLDEIAIYDRSLGETEIARHFRAALGLHTAGGDATR